ncbi:amino acid permease [Paraglaciecola sp.]|uniref:amino acid permease n=1 Tax=Paraglaciecola sp. TaxID=1920173 RepID=UPI0030F3815D
MDWRVKPLNLLLQQAQKKPLTRTLGAFQLTMLGVGAIIGTGIFVLAAVGAERAGPGLLLSFMIAGFICIFAAMAYAELAAMVPVAGSAYTYSYAAMGELIAWLVGWNLILEYAASAAAVAVGWSGYINGLLLSIGWELPVYLQYGGLDHHHPGGVINILAIGIVLAITGLLTLGTKESAIVNAILVCAKLVALCIFIALTLPQVSSFNLTPFMPYGFWSTEIEGINRGVMAAAALIFFAYVGFDAVSTAAEETKNPNRNIPIGLIASISICTIVYLLVILGALGTTPFTQLVGNSEPLAWVMRHLGYEKLGNILAIVAIFALPTVIMIMLYGQSRIFFVMSRDGLLPPIFSQLHARFNTPYLITIITGLVVATIAGFSSVAEIAELSNTGTLFAFAAVCIGVLILRVTQPDRPRPFRCPSVWIISCVALIGCAGLFFSLPVTAQLRFLIWSAIGLAIYLMYGYKRSPLAKNSI